MNRSLTSPEASTVRVLLLLLIALRVIELMRKSAEAKRQESLIYAQAEASATQTMPKQVRQP